VGALVVVTTVGTEEQANEIARELVCRRHAACVNIVPGLRSIYRWQGKVCRDTEFLLIVKTEEAEYPAVEATIQELHSYDLPEILGFKVGKGEPNFLAWIRAALDKSVAPCSPDDELEEPLVPLDETNY
jgi:periplasmic divalent cation tolerance protein